MKQLWRLGGVGTLALCGAMTLFCTPAPAQPGADGEFVRLMNLGKAYIENRSAQDAVETLTQAVARKPDSTAALRNLARAHMLTRGHKPAIEALKRAEKLDAESASTSYLFGVNYIRTTRFAEAVPVLERAVRLDPETAAVRFQLAAAYQSLDRHDEAKKQLRETVRLDPLHASAHFKLSVFARQEGDRKEFQARTREFVRLRKIFGDETRNAEALEVCAHTRPEAARPPSEIERAAFPPAIQVTFRDASGSVFEQDKSPPGRAGAVLEVDKSGRATVFVVDAQGGAALYRMKPDRRFERIAVAAKLSEWKGVRQCMVGDFHDDVPDGVKYDPRIHAFNDVLLVGPDGLRLWKRTNATAFQDVTEAANLAGLNANGAAWVDYDHDGDLDIALARASRMELWQNNGDGTFENVTAEVGITDTGSSVDVAAGELDLEPAIDLIVARGNHPTLVFENQRAGMYKAMPEPPGPWPPARRALLNDLNNDGRNDAVLVGDKEAIVLYGGKASRGRIDLGGVGVTCSVLFDYDNDGWLDLCVGGAAVGQSEKGALRVFRNLGGRWSDASEATGLTNLAIPPVRDILPFDADLDGDTDLFLVTEAGLYWLDNIGGDANKQLKILLTTVKTNPTGLSTHLELRSGDLLLTRTVSRLPIEIGVGSLQQFDSLQMLWSNGVVDNQVNLALPKEPLSILEKNVATGSCPFLYAWDGKRFRFVTDILGNAPIGLPQRRGVMLTADPDEIVYVGTSADFQPRAGRYVLQATEEFCEVLYLDQAKLLAVDHASDVEVHPTDKLMPEPFPPSELWAIENVRAAIRVMGDDGVERTSALRRIDGAYTRPGLPLPPPFRGMCHPLTLTLDFGALDPTAPLVLAMTGWLRYGQASTNVALGQLTENIVIPPTLEVETAAGWKPVDVIVGMPAGKTKTILVDLKGKLPPDARRLRLINTFEIRWDRIALGKRRSLPSARVHELLPVASDLRWRGFSEIKVRAPGHPDTPDYAAVSDQPPWRMVQEGWCTRYGDALELVDALDDQLAIVNAGDALTLEFDAGALPPLQTGLVRTFFFYSYGWEKDGDPNVTDGLTVGPLPVVDTFDYAALVPAISGALDGENRTTSPTSAVARPVSTELNWRLKYNTRYVPRDRFAPKR